MGIRMKGGACARYVSVWLLVGACAVPAGVTVVAAARPGQFDGSAMEHFWTIQDRLLRGDPVADTHWDALFETTAFQWQAPDEPTRGRIRKRMEIAFAPDPHQLDELLEQAEGYDVVRWRHYQRMRFERNELEGFLRKLTSSRIISEALTIAQEHLPEGTVQAQQSPLPICVLFFGPDAFAGDVAIYMDLLYAFDKGDGLTRLLAHEFHHVYYAQLSPLPSLDSDAELYPLVNALKQLHQEGVADRIDKRSFPLTEQHGGPPAYVAEYNEHYRGAADTLAQFDAALVDIANSESPGLLAREAWKLFHFAAHPEGFYMANTIATAHGAQALIEDTGDPFAFLRRFQSVQPVFSDEALAFLGALEVQLLDAAAKTQ